MKITKLAVFKAAFTTLALAASTLAGATNVAIVGGDSWYTPTLANDLIAAGDNVTVITSYTAASLAGYNAIVQDGNAFVDWNALNSFATAGGNVIEIPWSWTNYTPPTALGIFNSSGVDYGSLFPGVTILDPSNPLLAGVSFPAAGSVTIGRTTGTTFNADVTQIANYADGEAFIGEKALGAGEVIGINLHAITSDSNPYVITQLFVNAADNGSNNVPEPESLALVGVSLIGLIATKRRRNKQAAM